MPDDDSQGQNDAPGTNGGAPMAPPRWGDQAPPPGPPPAFPPSYHPGYPPPPGAEPTYQAPAPWAPPSFPPVIGTTPLGPPPGPPPGPVAGFSNGSGHDPSPSRRRRRMILTVFVPIVVVAFVIGLLGVAVFGGSTSTVTPPSTGAVSPAARQLLRSALAAADQVGAFHYVSTSSVAGPDGGTQKTVGDAGAASGRQVITVGNQKFTVLVIGTACYLKGNAAALVGNLGLPSSLAPTYAGRWISLAKTDGPYASVYAAVTARSALTDNITIVPQNQSATTRLAGRRVQTVSGAIAPIRIAGQLNNPKGTATLAVRASSPHLPVRYTEQGTLDHEKNVSTITFSHWGEAVHLTAPSGAVAFSSIGSGSGTTPSTPSGTVLT